MLVEYIRALLPLAKLFVPLQLLLMGCRKSLPLLGKDFSCMQLIDNALEGSMSGLPVPSVAALQEVSKKLTKLELGTLCT